MIFVINLLYIIILKHLYFIIKYWKIKFNKKQINKIKIIIKYFYIIFILSSFHLLSLLIENLKNKTKILHPQIAEQDKNLLDLIKSR